MVVWRLAFSLPKPRLAPRLGKSIGQPDEVHGDMERMFPCRRRVGFSGGQFVMVGVERDGGIGMSNGTKEEYEFLVETRLPARVKGWRRPTQRNGFGATL